MVDRDARRGRQRAIVGGVGAELRDVQIDADAGTGSTGTIASNTLVAQRTDVDLRAAFAKAF